MGRYDGPHFSTENEDVVSIWVATCPLTEIPDEYFEDNHDENDDTPFNQFSSDFGFGYYDHDLVEANRSENSKATSLTELLQPMSYSQSFLAKATQLADSLQIKESSYIFILYNFKYCQKTTGISESKYMRFLGVFPYVRAS
ncbi:immunity 22 family protein [Aquipseudomonas alcaligenes]|uniref:Ypar27 n=1 Tax=Aquipseudomonas alcaligenes TaxID=43263 RepID=Q939E6_AQUAC|nr:immunity 22 family protein [Pseudomonas alcaligenes]AAK73312.1 Ypar27 [Pseudomonas alcaligenes]